MEELKKPNDILVATLSAPNSSVLDLLLNNINADNTSFMTKEEYKQTPFIKKQFTDLNGVFNEDAFNKLYNVAELKYRELDDDKLFDNLATYLEYGSTSRYRPINSERRDNIYTPEKYSENTMQLSIGLKGFNKKDEPTLTPEELALRNKIWDPVNKTWLEETPESRNIFNKLFGETLVYATYDKDGNLANPITGEVGEHYRGEFIKDENGQYFTELLGNRELLDKLVVAVLDILTREDSAINKIDFFDSDGYKKSIGGVVAKTTAAIIPYLIPGFNAYYGAFTAAVGLASVMPTFYKSLESLFTGEDITGSYKAATAAENWFRKFEPSTSHEGRGKFFSAESMGNMVADIFGQLYQLRAAASLAKFLYKTPQTLEEAEKLNKAAKAFSLGYMGLVSVSDVYNDALQGGYDKRTAGIASLFSAAALFGIMNYNEGLNGLGTWFLDKTTGYNHEITRKPIARIAKSLFKDIEYDLQKALETGDKKVFLNSLSKFRSSVRNWMDDAFRVGSENIWKNAIVEGVEEVSEEVVQDSVKGVIDTLSWLGFTGKLGSFGGWSNVFSKEGASRYLQTLLGGAVGGALFSVQLDILEPAMIRRFKDPNYKSEQEILAELDILDAVLRGRTDELIEELKRCKTIFSNNRAATGTTDADGTYHDLKADGQKSQADMIVDAAIELVHALDKWVKDELRGADFDFSIFAPAEQSALRLIFKLQIADKLHIKTGEDTQKKDKGNQLSVGYISNKFITAIQELKRSYDVYQTSKQASLKKSDDSKEINESETLATQTKSVNLLDQQKKDYEDKLSLVRHFFNGKAFVETFEEVSHLHSDLLLLVLGQMDLETFYETLIKSKTFNKNFKDLEEDSTDPNKMTKKKVESMWKMFKNENSSMDALTKKLPLVRLMMHRIQALISPNIGEFVSLEHKHAIIKSLDKIVFNLETVKKYLLDLLDDLVVFDEEALDSTTDEEQYADHFELISLTRELILSSRTASNFVRLILANPKAWTLNQRFNVDYATKLLDSGAIVVEGYNDEQLKYLKELINTLAVAARINLFTPAIIRALVTNVNDALSDSGNLYRLRILDLADKSDNVVDTPFGSVLAGNIDVMPEITEFKLNSLLDYIGDDAVLSEDLYRLTINTFKAAVIEKFEAIKTLLPDSDQIQQMNRILDALLKEPIDPNNRYIKNAANNIASFISLLFPLPTVEVNPQKEQLLLELAATDEERLRVQKMSNDRMMAEKVAQTLGIQLSVNENGEQYYDFSESILLSIISKDLDRLLAFLAKYLENLLVNPITEALKKIFFKLTGSEQGSSIIDWAVKKAQAVVEGKGNADEIEFTKEELDGINSAIITIDIVKLAVGLMISYTSQEGRYGVNQMMVDYIKAYKNSDQALLDLFLLISKEDGVLVNKILEEAQQQLRDLAQIKLELTANKVALYITERETNIERRFAFYSNVPLKVHIPDLEDIELLTDSDREFSGGNLDEKEQFVLQCDQKIAAALNKLKDNSYVKSKTSASHSANEVIIDLLWDSFGANTSPAELFVSGRLVSEAINVTEEGNSSTDIQWLLGHFVGMLNISPKEIETKVANILKLNPQIYPRLDLLDCLYKIIAVLNNLKEFNYLNLKLVDKYNDNPDVWEKDLLTNVMFLFGSGGSGKTLMATLLKSEYQAKFPDKVYVMAKALKKVDELDEAFTKLDISHKKCILSNLVANLDSLSLAYKAAEHSLVSAGTVVSLKDSSFDISKVPSDISTEISEDGKNLTLSTQVKDGDDIIATLSLHLPYSSVSEGHVLLKVDVDLNKDLVPTVEDGSIIILDECTLLNAFEWKVLTKVTQDHNITVLALGDPTLQSDIISYELSNKQPVSATISTRYLFGTFLPELVGTWRADNNATWNNARLVRGALRKENAVGNDGDFKSNAFSAEDIKLYESKAKNIIFKYTTTGSTDKFMGTCVTKDGAKIKNIISLIPPTDSLAVIINSVEERDSVKLELEALGINTEKVDFSTLEDILGAEYDYVISYKVSTPGISILSAATKCYTEITRARKGNLVIQANSLDLFDAAGLSLSKEDDVVKMSSIDTSKENAELVSKLEAAISSMEDVTYTGTSISLPPPGTSVLSTNPEAVLDDGSGTNLELDDDAPEKDYEKYKTAIAETYTKAGYTNFIIRQGWYFHIGESKEVIKKLRNGDSLVLSDLIEKASKLEELPDDGQASELVQFIKILLLVQKGEVNLGDGGTYFKNIIINKLGDIPSILSNGNNLVRAYKKFVRLLRGYSKYALSYLFKVQDYDKKTDYPLDKVNDRDPDRLYLTRIGFPIVGIKDNKVFNFFITTGTMGFTEYTRNGEKVSTAEDFVLELYSEQNRNRTIKKLLKSGVTNIAGLNLVQGKSGKHNLRTISSASASTSVTSVRTPGLKVTAVPEEFNLSHAKHGRYSLADAINYLGLKLVTDASGNVIEFKSSSSDEDTQKKDFINWLNLYRVEALTTDLEKSRKKLYNLRWIIVEYEGSGELFAVEVSYVYKTLKDKLLYKPGDTFTWGSKSEKSGLPYLNAYSHKSIVLGLIHILTDEKVKKEILDKFNKLPEIIFNKSTLKFENTTLYEDFCTALLLALRTDPNFAILGLVGSLDSSGFLKNWVNSEKFRSTKWFRDETKKAWPKEVVDASEGRVSYDSNPSSEFNKFVAKLDSVIGENFFLRTAHGISLTDPAMLDQIVISLPYEDSNEIINIDMLEDVVITPTQGKIDSGKVDGSEDESELTVEALKTFLVEDLNGKEIYPELRKLVDGLNGESLLDRLSTVITNVDLDAGNSVNYEYQSSDYKIFVELCFLADENTTNPLFNDLKPALLLKIDNNPNITEIKKDEDSKLVDDLKIKC